MIVLKLQGGLGNQMFQYAFLKNMQRFYNDDKACIDISGTIKDKERGATDGFMLSKFQIDPTIKIAACKKEYKLNILNKIFLSMIKLCKHIKFFRWLLYLIAPFAAFFGGIIFEDEKYILKKYRKSINRTKFIFGYFPGERYFAEISDDIKREFELHDDLDEFNQKLKEEIQQEESVCVHLRFGDYLTLAHIYDVLDHDYYEKAIRFIGEETKAARFYVFSNDMEKAKERLKDFGNVVYVDRKASSIVDFELMKSCKHFIIPNSTFSWWAQYLGTNENKIVVAPRVWLKGLPYKMIMLNSWTHV